MRSPGPFSFSAMFIDRVHITVQGGHGGNGCNSFFRRADRKVIAHGGDGGRGGDVIFRADTNAQGLGIFRFNQTLSAAAGGNGGSEKKRGRSGENLVVLVLPGTRIMDREKNMLIRHLLKPGDEVVVAQGGSGGQGNIGGKESSNGDPGAVLEIELTLHIPADVFLIGLPNSGKSTLMNRLTRAHLKEEAYPFSTREPKIGVWAVSEYESVTLCELPSIYEASHEGRGMGSDFLKHLEGAKQLLYVIDPVSQFAGSLAEGYAILRKELEIYSEDFLHIPHAVVVNKMDLAEAPAKGKKKKFDAGCPVFYISALNGEGMEKLQAYLKNFAVQHA
jgi:GTP-binding protein